MSANEINGFEGEDGEDLLRFPTLIDKNAHVQLGDVFIIIAGFIVIHFFSKYAVFTSVQRV